MTVYPIADARHRKATIKALQEAVMRLKAMWTELFDEFEAQKVRIRYLEAENAKLRQQLRRFNATR